MENSIEVFQKNKIPTQFEPAIALLSIHSKKTKILMRKDVCTLMFIAAMFTIAKT